MLPRESFSSIEGIPVWTTHSDPNGEYLIVKPGFHRRDLFPETKFDCHVQEGFVLIPNEPCFYGIPNSLAWGLTMDLNRATISDLQQISGVGPKTAESIVNYRNDNGSYKSVRELEKVHGIGRVKYEKIRSYLRIQPDSSSTTCPLEHNHDK
jgi:comEA protein